MNKFVTPDRTTAGMVRLQVPEKFIRSLNYSTWFSKVDQVDTFSGILKIYRLLKG